MLIVKFENKNSNLGREGGVVFNTGTGRSRSRLPFPFLFSCIILIFGVFSLCAQELSEKQRSVAERYAQLEQVLLRMSEATAAVNPRRAALLKKVLLAGKDKLVAIRLENIVEVLERRQLTEAVGGQEEIEKDLLELLLLLESENRDQRRTAEKEKIKEFLRNLEEIIHQEKSLKNKTAQKENENLTPLEKEQKDIRLRTQTLRDQIADNENPDAVKKDQPDKEKDSETQEKNEKIEKTGNSKSEQSGSGEKKGGAQKSDKKDSEKEQNNEQKKDSEQKEQSSSDKKKEEKKDEEKPSGSPTQQAMQKALQRMNEAEQKLQKAEKSGALEDQEEAIAELQRVKAELEKILRQLREEELLQTLEKLEARFKRMLRVEQSIRAQTGKVGDEVKNAEESAKRQIQIQASRIGADQQSVIEDADAALILLREDGTAQAMVESLLQTRFDMTEVKARLDQTEVDSITQDIEDAIIVSLQEMLEAVERAIKEAEKRKEQQQTQGSEGGKSELEPLIQLLSELKMIRSMQQRVNERTERYEKAIDQLRNEPNPDYGSLRKKVEELTRQQNRISRILHDLKVGKAK